MRVRSKALVTILLLVIAGVFLFWLSPSKQLSSLKKAPQYTSTKGHVYSTQDGGSDASAGDGGVEIDHPRPAPSQSDKPPIASDIKISDIELNQGVGILLVYDGIIVDEKSREAPVIAHRPALTRIFWKTDVSFVPKKITAVLKFKAPDSSVSVYTQTKFIVDPPQWNTLHGSFNWEIEAQDLQPGVTLSAALYDLSKSNITEPSPSPLPKINEIDLGIKDLEMQLNIVIVPSSMSCSPLSPIEIPKAKQEILEAEIFNMFPLSTLNIDFHEPVTFELSSCGNGLEVLAELARLRDTEQAPPSTFYHAVFPYEDTEYFLDHYSSGYATWYEPPGLGDERVSYSVAFINNWINSVGHEIGHNLGRPHTFEDQEYEPSDPSGRPCGRRSTWGWGIISAPHSAYDYFKYKELSDMNGWLIPPTDDLELNEHCLGFKDNVALNDIMSYAYPYWVSAYTYSHLALSVELLSSWTQATHSNELNVFENTLSLHGFFDEEDSKATWVLLRGRPASSGIYDDNNYAIIHLDSHDEISLPIVYKRAGSDGEIIGTVVLLPDDLDWSTVLTVTVTQNGKVHPPFIWREL